MELPIDYENASFSERRIAREKYIRLQKGKCYYCGKPLYGPPSTEVLGYNLNLKLFPDNFFDSHIHLHHSHVTGLTLGAVHSRCNAVLWQKEGE